LFRYYILLGEGKMSKEEPKKISPTKMAVYIGLILLIGLTIPYNMWKKQQGAQQQPPLANTTQTQAQQSL
jgi:hypothetical protein